MASDPEIDVVGDLANSLWYALINEGEINGQLTKPDCAYLAEWFRDSVRNRPPEWVAELIGGQVENDGVPDMTGGWHLEPTGRRAVGPWTEAPHA